MKFQRGRLIDHIHLNVADLGRSRTFYDAVLVALEREITFDFGSAFGSDELFIEQAENGFSRIHFAFQADGPEMVKRFHEAGLRAGGSDNGAPGERPYHPGYYAAYLRDPDGNNIEAVYHGPHTRSCAAVELTALPPK
ncbi:VOC family protein [Mariluticola halotolerans]|uniref:VOC family protein n=1 Tax=Mariluticola halotolerans TaxID=2909283 RepID=UPI0026E14AD3|nr:VOC family protein [Mariluticola halotolerans]UJQ93660.1 VOC family protein [Mariluticola halotolerans]